MRIRRRFTDQDDRQPQLQMSSLIDVVFLLLIFFVMTFHITAREGDFDVSAARPGAANFTPSPPRDVVFHVRLLADEKGGLDWIQFDGRRLADVTALHALVKQIVEEHVAGGGRIDDLAVELRCAVNLEYGHTIDAITAIRGEAAGDDRVRNLIRDIRFGS